MIPTSEGHYWFCPEGRKTFQRFHCFFNHFNDLITKYKGKDTKVGDMKGEWRFNPNQSPVDLSLMDEDEQTRYFENLCGGVQQAQRLFNIWKRSSPQQWLRGKGSRERIFFILAKNEGFTDEQCETLLRIK